MTKRMQVYKCEICGNIVEVLHEGAETLVCCGEPMELLEEKTADASTEKHVPFIKREDNKYRKHLNPGDAPEAAFEIPEGKEVIAREMCNIHKLWIKK